MKKEFSLKKPTDGFLDLFFIEPFFVQDLCPIAEKFFYKREINLPITILTPLNRYGTPEDMAGVVVYLASDDADYVTGHILYVDGGCLCRACY